MDIHVFGMDVVTILCLYRSKAKIIFFIIALWTMDQML